MTTSVTFYGVRGSTPCACESSRRYGGNTSCVVVQPQQHPPIVLDLGTGLRFYGLDGDHDEPFNATALVTHLHWDHVQGIPFFGPLLAEGSMLDVYAPEQGTEALEDTMKRFLSPPYFPVGVSDLPGEIRFNELAEASFEVPGATINSAWVPHKGPTLGYRIETDDTSIVYISDHQQPGVSDLRVTDEVLELCDGADLLIHDAQYDELEFAVRADWGHCTVDFAVEVAARAGVGTLALFHHDPSHTDTRIDELTTAAAARGQRLGVGEVMAAREGVSIEYGQSCAATTPADGSIRFAEIAQQPLAGRALTGQALS